MFQRSKLFRTEFIATLLKTGRLADLPMLNHYVAKVDQEVAGVLQTTTKPVAQPAVDVAPELKSPRDWIGKVYGHKEWFVSTESPGDFTVAKVGKNYKIKGAKFAVGGDSFNAKPSSLMTIANIIEGESNTVGIFRVDLSSAQKHNVTLQRGGVQAFVELDNCDCTPIPLKEGHNLIDEATKSLSLHRLATCSNFVTLLKQVEHVLSLHATSTVQYDGLLLRDQNVQKAISELRCASFAIDSLVSFCTETMNTADINIAKIFACNAFQSAVEGAVQVIGPLHELRAKHNSNPAITINYEFVHNVAALAPHFMNLDGWNSDLAVMTLTDALVLGHNTLSKLNQSSPLNSLLGVQSGGVRLASPHLNLAVTAQALEKDLTAFLNLCGKKKVSGKSDDSTFVDGVAQYLGEVFATTAVLYRCTASLTVDEEVLGQQEWLWTQAFCDLSRVRRADILRRLQADEHSVKAVWAALENVEYDELAIHPVEVSMMAVAKKSTEGAKK